jgi:hypothetical protein
MKKDKEEVFYLYLSSLILEVFGNRLFKDKVVKKKITPGQLIFLGAIVGLSKKEGFCYAGNQRLSNLTTLSVKSIERWVLDFEDEKVIFRSYKKGTRRLRVHNNILDKYPELKNDIAPYQIPHHEETIPHDEETIPHDEGTIPHDEESAYYIYKYNINKIKSKLKDSDFFTFDFNEENFQKYLNSTEYKAIKNVSNEAFLSVKEFYPIKNNFKKGAAVFEKMTGEQHKKFFESLYNFRKWAEAQKLKNIQNSEIEAKYIPQIKSYIEDERYLEYLKVTKKEGSGTALATRVKKYAKFYSFQKEDLEIEEIDKKINQKYLLQLVVHVFNNGLDEQALAHIEQIERRAA